MRSAVPHGEQVTPAGTPAPVQSALSVLNRRPCPAVLEHREVGEGEPDPVGQLGEASCRARRAPCRCAPRPGAPRPAASDDRVQLGPHGHSTMDDLGNGGDAHGGEHPRPARWVVGAVSPLSTMVRTSSVGAERREQARGQAPRRTATPGEPTAAGGTVSGGERVAAAGPVDHPPQQDRGDGRAQDRGRVDEPAEEGLAPGGIGGADAHGRVGRRAGTQAGQRRGWLRDCPRRRRRRRTREKTADPGRRRPARRCAGRHADQDARRARRVGRGLGCRGGAGRWVGNMVDHRLCPIDSRYTWIIDKGGRSPVKSRSRGLVDPALSSFLRVRG